MKFDRKAASGRRAADLFDALQVLLAVAPPTHPSHERRRDVLQRQVEVRDRAAAISSISSSVSSEGYRYSSRTRVDHALRPARTSGTIERSPRRRRGRRPPGPVRPGRSRGHPTGRPRRGSTRSIATLCGPRNDGMAQNPQALSQPSATFTYAHGRATRGRGRLSRSSDGTGSSVADSDRPPGLAPSVTGTPNPATESTSGSASASSAPYRSAMQPVTTSSRPSARTSSRARIVAIDSSRASSTNAQVLTTTRSASSADAGSDQPSASIVPVSLSESTWFLGQPRVSTQKERGTVGRV